MTFFLAGILIPEGFLVWHSNHEIVRTTVAVDVVRVGEEVIRIAILSTQLALEARDRSLFARVEGKSVGINRVACFEIRPGIPIRPAEDIDFVIGVHIGYARALGPEIVADFVLHPFSRQLGRFRGNHCGCGTGGGKER